MVLPEQQCWSVANDPTGWSELLDRLLGFSISAIGVEAPLKSQPSMSRPWAVPTVS
jgi:hypothetical protein